MKEVSCDAGALSVITSPLIETADVKRHLRIHQSPGGGSDGEAIGELGVNEIAQCDHRSSKPLNSSCHPRIHQSPGGDSDGVNLGEAERESGVGGSTGDSESISESHPRH